MAIAPLGAPIASVLQAYQASGGSPSGAVPAGVGVSSFADLAGTNAAGTGSGGLPPVDFGAMVTNALRGTVQAGHTAEQGAIQAIQGNGNLIDVVSAISKAELSLQTTLAVRDRVVSAYQDIMHMAI